MALEDSGSDSEESVVNSPFEENTEVINYSQIDLINPTDDSESYESSEEEDDDDIIEEATPENQIAVRKQFNELIENCQEYKDDDEIEEDLKGTLNRSIHAGKKLFNKLGDDPGNLYFACLHAKTCSTILLSKTEKIGSKKNVFTLDAFLASFYEKVQEETLVTMLAAEANRAQRTLPTITALLGSFDRSIIMAPPEIIPKKVRGLPRRKNFDETDGPATEHEQVQVTDAERAIKDKQSPEARSRELFKLLKKVNKMNGSVPTNMMEFAMDKDALKTYFTKLFYVSFLARDGHVSIRRKKRKIDNGRKFDSDLYLNPEEPPQKIRDDRDSIPRSQHIVSFNSKIYKALSHAYKGPQLVKFQDEPNTVRTSV